MFQTLKASNGGLGDSEFIVRSSIAASDKVKTVKKQAACTRCKMKKLRCDIEGNSCEKCIEAGVTCSYNSTRAGSENRSSCSAEGVIQRPDSPPTGECIAVINRPDNRPAAPSPPPPDAGLHDNLPSGATHPHFGSNSSGDEGSRGGDPSSTLIDSAIATPSFMANLGAWMDSGLAHDTHSEARASGFLDAASSQNGDILDDFDICYCVDRIISANATMQVKLIWVSSLDGCSTSSIDDILQCQKNVLASCEAFLGCGKCIHKSGYVVIVISMCREMVSGIKTLQRITSPEPSSSSSPPQSGAPRRPSNGGSSVERSSSQDNSYLGAGGWHLDDDDEVEIIRNLIQVRIKKLKKLIDLLELVVMTNHASYIWIVGSLRDILDDKLDLTAPQTGVTMALNG